MAAAPRFAQETDSPVPPAQEQWDYFAPSRISSSTLCSSGSQLGVVMADTGPGGLSVTVALSCATGVKMTEAS
jgi:hypothetical protein